MRFFIMDVFTSEKYSGNQLAVVFARPGLDTATMQSIAREFNFSETTFIIPPDAGASGDGIASQPAKNPVRVRIFTPNRELPFAGHPTLGTALVLREEFRARNGAVPERVVLDLDVGNIPVDFQGDSASSEPDGLVRGYMLQKPGEVGESLDAKTLSDALSLSPGDFAAAPALEISTGVPVLLARLNSLDALKRIKLNRPAFDRVFENLDASGLHVHARETHHPENDINCRLFAPAVGVPEDPATGSAAGCLAEYIRRVDGIKEPFELRVEQGYEMNRPSLLLTGFTDDSTGPRVGGYAVQSARGELV